MIRKVAEAIVLLGMVVQRIAVRRRRFDTQIVVKRRPGDEICEVASDTANFGKAFIVIVAATDVADLPAEVERSASGGNVDNSRGAIAILRGQGTGNEVDLVGV